MVKMICADKSQSGQEYLVVHCNARANLDMPVKLAGPGKRSIKALSSNCPVC